LLLCRAIEGCERSKRSKRRREVKKRRKGSGLKYTPPTGVAAVDQTGCQAPNMPI
jgi:hypothetical protein